MAMDTAKLLLVVMAVIMMVAVAEGQSSSCTSLVTELLPCLPYLSPGNTSTPDAACCTPISTLLNSSSADCFCNFTSFASLVNISRAPEIATACNATIPESVLACFQTNASSPSPSPSTPSTLSSSPPTPSTPSPPGSNSSSTGGSGSGSNEGFAVSPTRNIVMWALVLSVGGGMLV